MEQQRCLHPAALFTKDAVLVNNTGPIYGRDATEKMYAELFQKVHFSNHVAKPDPYSPHIIGTTGNEMWWNGEWNVLFKARPAILYKPRAIGHRLLFATAMLGGIGFRSGTQPQQQQRRSRLESKRVPYGNRRHRPDDHLELPIAS